MSTVVLIAAILALGSSRPQQKSDQPVTTVGAKSAAKTDPKAAVKAVPAAGKEDAVKAAHATTPRKSSRPPAPPETFEKGLGAFYWGDFVAAAGPWYDYLATTRKTGGNYEGDEHFAGP